VTGDLTLKGITKSITFDLELSGPSKDPFGFERIGLEGSVQVNRKDWNLSWNAPLETGGVLIAEKVTLEFDIEATKVTA
jgi:polyisoprenoid-binding protein YceI